MAFTFADSQPGIQLGTQQAVPHLGDCYTERAKKGPPFVRSAVPLSMVDPVLVAACTSYRDAVRLCFTLRRVDGMCLRSIAEHAGIHIPHMTDFVHRDNSKTRRDMPAKYIPAFEAACGNAAVSQYIARCAGLTVAEESANTTKAA